MITLNIKMERLQKLPWLLIWIFSFLFFMNLLVIIVPYLTGHNSIYGLFRQFSFDKENNIPTYFSSINLLLCACLIFYIYRAYKVKNTASSGYWLALSILFLFLSADESTSIHEMLTRPTDQIFGGFTSGWLYYPWVISGVVIFVAVAAFFLKFYLRLPLRYRLLFGASAALLVGGAIGMEIVDGYFVSISTSTLDLVPNFLVTLEESIEMLGAIVFIYSLIDYIKVKISNKDGESLPAGKFAIQKSASLG